jgi:hypothetical protein
VIPPTLVMARVCPSGAARAIASTPTTPPPPARFSTTTALVEVPRQRLGEQARSEVHAGYLRRDAVAELPDARRGLIRNHRRPVTPERLHHLLAGAAVGLPRPRVRAMSASPRADIF